MPCNRQPMRLNSPVKNRQGETRLRCKNFTSHKGVSTMHFFSVWAEPIQSCSVGVRWIAAVRLVTCLAAMFLANPALADHFGSVSAPGTVEVLGDVQHPNAAMDLSGQWSGRWCSQSTGHQGVLRADFVRCGENRYQVTFTGRFLKLLPFRYSVMLDVVSVESGSVALSGNAFLGKLFGTFCYQATATDCRFTSTYTSAKDSGTFIMQRISR